MASVLLNGQTEWEMTRDEKGHRDYKLTHYVLAATTDGPAVVINTPGLPLPGSPWIIDDDYDLWAYCTFEATVKPLQTKEPNNLWSVEQKFTTKPMKECKEQQFEDPLLEPQKVSGSYNRFQEEATHDKDGNRIYNSSWEMFRGPQVEFDESRLTIRVEQNVASLELARLEAMKDCVNLYPLWGFEARCIKLSGIQWERKYHGFCYVYYTRSFEFEVAVRNADSPHFLVFPSKHDRILLDEGTKVLNGKWDRATGNYKRLPVGSGVLNPDENGVLNPDVTVPINPDFMNPRHFKRYKDINDENTRVLLDGGGLPAGSYIDGPTTGTGTGSSQQLEPADIFVQKYHDADFLLLGIPIVF